MEYKLTLDCGSGLFVVVLVICACIIAYVNVRKH